MNLIDLHFRSRREAIRSSDFFDKATRFSDFVGLFPLDLVVSPIASLS